MEIEAQFRAPHYSPFTRWNYLKALRQLLRWLWENHGAPKLDQTVRRPATPRPRNVTVTEDERAALLAASPPHLRLWLLLCGDLAIRSGTAARIAPENWDAQRGQLTFTTKCDERLSLPATADVAALIALCEPTDPRPFVAQLWARHNRGTRGAQLRTYDPRSLRAQLAAIRKALGIRRVTPHDHRRTAAVAMLRHTHDIREVQALLGHKNLQSTFWYLDHDLRPIERATLEAIKKPFIVHRKEKTA